MAKIIQVVHDGQETCNRDEFSQLCFEIASGLRFFKKFWFKKIIFFSSKSGEKESNEELEDIIKLVESIRLGKAEKSQQLSIISRTISQIRKVKNGEENLTELAFLLQACRGTIKPFLKSILTRQISVWSVVLKILLENQNFNCFNIKSDPADYHKGASFIWRHNDEAVRIVSRALFAHSELSRDAVRAAFPRTSRLPSLPLK